MDHVYFPVSSIVSLVYVMEGGQEAEFAVVGLNGFVGVSTLMGGESTPSSTLVKCTGQAFRLSSQMFKKEFTYTPVMHLLLRFAQASITQITQTAVCNRLHTLRQQLCRSLLFSFDRVPGDELVMTQELIANTLGVRREGISEAAFALQNSGVISCARGRIRMLDRTALDGMRARNFESLASIEAATVAAKRKLASLMLEDWGNAVAASGASG